MNESPAPQRRPYGRYERLYAVRDALGELRNRARELAAMPPMPLHLANALQEQAAEHFQRLVDITPELGRAALRATNSEMTRLPISFRQDEGGDVVVVMHGGEGVAPIEGAGVIPVDVHLTGYSVQSEFVEGDKVRLKPYIHLETLEPSEVAVTDKGMFLGKVVIYRTILFPADSNGELIVPELDQLRERKKLYEAFPNTDPSITAIQNLERALMRELPNQYVELKKLELLHTIARLLEASSESMSNRKKDSVLSLLDSVISPGRVLVLGGSDIRIMSKNRPQKTDNYILGKFMRAIVREGASQIILEVADNKGEPVLASVPMSTIDSFQF